MKRKVINECKLVFPAFSRNESLSRSAAAAFALQCDPEAAEIAAIKTAVSEAVTNAIVHGYRDSEGNVEMNLRLYDDNVIYISVKDKGRGIPDVEQAMEPMYSTAPEDEERSGLGFTVMQTFMDRVRVRSEEGKGTVVILEKQLSGKH